MKKLDILK